MYVCVHAVRVAVPAAPPVPHPYAKACNRVALRWLWFYEDKHGEDVTHFVVQWQRHGVDFDDSPETLVTYDAATDNGDAVAASLRLTASKHKVLASHRPATAPLALTDGATARSVDAAGAVLTIAPPSSPIAATPRTSRPADDHASESPIGTSPAGGGAPSGPPDDTEGNTGLVTARSAGAAEAVSVFSVFDMPLPGRIHAAPRAGMPHVERGGHVPATPVPRRDDVVEDGARGVDALVTAGAPAGGAAVDTPATTVVQAVLVAPLSAAQPPTTTAMTVATAAETNRPHTAASVASSVGRQLLLPHIANVATRKTINLQRRNAKIMRAMRASADPVFHGAVGQDRWGYQVCVTCVRAFVHVGLFVGPCIVCMSWLPL